MQVFDNHFQEESGWNAVPSRPTHLSANDYIGQQRFCPTRKNVCFWCIFGCWIQIRFHNFSIIHTFHSRLKGWNLLCQDTKVCFYHGHHEEFKDFFSQEDGVGVVFCNDVCSIVEVLGHEYNQDQWCLFIVSSKVSLKVVLLHFGNRFLSVMQPTWRRVTKAWGYWWEGFGMTNLSGHYVVISMLWHCYSECNLGTQNNAVSCASGTARTRKITT